MEIYDNPLTPEKMATRVDQAVTNSATPKEAFQKTLHAGLRNCIWSGNIECMRSILDAYREIDLNRDFGKGALLCYAASAPLLI